MVDETAGSGPDDSGPREFGDYTLLEVLGRGGIGVVYRAVQRTLDRPVALKRLRIAWGEADEVMRRFHRGARAASQVEHDHAVPIYDFGVVDGEPFLVMSLLRGPGLERILEDLARVEDAPFGPAHHAVLDRAEIPGEGTDTEAFVRRIAALLAGPASALERYHAAGVIHRDVKPANLILGPSGRLVLVDFDLVKWTESSVADLTRSPLGSPVYMSPEQWGVGGELVDGRCDVYSMGAVLYELLTLRPPFEAESAPILMRRILEETPEDPGDRVPGLPEAARRVTLKCLEKRAGDRYAGAGDLARDLEALAAGRPVEARPVARATRATRWLRRRKVPVLAIGLLALAALVAWAVWPRTITLEVFPHPQDGDVYLARLVGGEPRGQVFLGRAPIIDHSVQRGRYRLTIRLEGFSDHVENLTLDADSGSRRRVEPYFLRRQERPRYYGLDRSDFAYDLNSGRSAVAENRILYPRGRIHADDAASFGVELDGVLEGRLVIQDADGGLLHREPIRITSTGRPIPFSDAARATLAAIGDHRWGFEVAGRQPLLVDVSVVPGSSEDATREVLAAYEPAEQRQGELTAIARLGKDGFHVAAWRRAHDLGASWNVREAHQLALRSLDALGLGDSRAWVAAARAYERSEPGLDDEGNPGR